MSTLPLLPAPTPTPLTSYTMITGVYSLPAELLLQILSLSFVSGGRKESYKVLMLVCRRFVGPARQLLHRDIVTLTKQQSNSLLNTLHLYPNLCVVTRRFNLTYTIGNFNGLRGSVHEGQARELLSLLWNVRDLVVQNDDGCKILRETITASKTRSTSNILELQEDINLTTPPTTNFDQTPTTATSTRTGLEELRSLTVLNPSVIRWNDLVTLIKDSPKLRTLSVSGLCEPLPIFELPPPAPPGPSSSKVSSDSLSSDISTMKERDLEAEESKKEIIRIKKYYARLEKLLVPPPSSNSNNNGIPYRRSITGGVINDNHDDIGRWGLDMITIEDTNDDEDEVLIIEDSDDEDNSAPISINARASTATTTTTTNITQALATPEVPLILLPPNYLTFPHPNLTSLTLDQTTITDILLSRFLTTIRRSLSSFKLRNTKSITRLGFITILEKGLLRGLLELEISNCDFDHGLNDNLGLMNVGTLAGLFGLGPGVVPLPVPVSTNPRVRARQLPPPLPQTFNLSLNLPENYQTFLDDLPTYCPFLQELLIGSEKLCSIKILNILIKNLPLANLGLEFLRPKLGILELNEMFNGGSDDTIGSGGGMGRLESLWIGKGMKWTKVIEAEARAICFKAGTMFTTSDDL